MYFPPLNYLKAKVFTLLLSLALSSIHICNPNHFELSSSKEKQVSVKLNSPIVICIFCFVSLSLSWSLPIRILIFFPTSARLRYISLSLPLSWSLPTQSQYQLFFSPQRDREKRPWSSDEEFCLSAKNSEVGLLYFVVS